MVDGDEGPVSLRESGGAIDLVVLQPADTIDLVVPLSQASEVSSSDGGGSPYPASKCLSGLNKVLAGR